MKYSSFAAERLLEIYSQLLDALGPSRWWPAVTPLEVVVGAILTQNTAWTNVEKALANMNRAGLLPVTAPNDKELAESTRDSGERLLALSNEELAELIHPAGYYRVKAGRLRTVLEFFRDQCLFDLKSLSRSTLTDDELRSQLLRLRGVGPETADSILLYALERPSFVVDAYTLRLLDRHAFLPGAQSDYDLTRALFMASLPRDAGLYNEYHALIVRACKEWCVKTSPRCLHCPLGYGLQSASLNIN